LFAPVLLASLLAILFAAGSARGVHDLGLFELDKNATNDLTTTHLAILNSNANATQTTIQVCRFGASDPSLPFTILIDAEQMSVTASAAAGGGGCPSGTAKRNYTVTRHVNGSLAAAHAAGSDVTRMVTGSVPGDDWNQIYDEVQADPETKCTDLGAVECAFVHDGTNATIFTTGGSKDDHEISDWRWTNGSVPDADEINDAMAAKYISASNDEILYFAADRFAVNGAKDFGFWFFQNPVAANEDGTGTFSGSHTGTLTTPGDILILGTFTQGGATTTVRVFKWVGSGGSDGSLDSDATLGDCAVALSGDQGCATVNDTTIPTGGWAYQGKASSAANVILSGGFVEGGINLSELGLEGCFSSFMAETRSSPEIGAQLKDFILGSFEACESSLTTTPADSGGTALTDTNSNGIPDVTIGTGAAGVDVTDQADLTVEGTNTWSGTLHFFLCGPIATGTCDTDGLEIGSGTAVNQDTVMPVVSGAANLTSVGRYCWRGFFDSNTEGVADQTDASEGECFEVLPVTPVLATQAGADVTLGSPITDSATLIGTAFQPGDDGPNATYPSINATMDTPANGTITFTLFGPGNCTDVPTGFTPIDVTVSGDRTTHPGYTASFTPTQVGEFTWVATYSGDSPNTNGAGPTTCPDPNEAVVVTGNAASSSAQRWLPNDRVTLTGDTSLNGTLTVTLYSGDNCGVTSGSPIDGQSYTFDVVNGDPNGVSFNTDNTTFYVGTNPDGTAGGAPGAYSWLVHYDDNTLNDPLDRCETSTVSITD
jgi:hypothetical protein